MPGEVNPGTPESFGVYPGDPGYDTFDGDFPISDQPITDYNEADFAMGEQLVNPEASAPEDSVVTFPETADEENARVSEWLRDHYQV